MLVLRLFPSKRSKASGKKLAQEFHPFMVGSNDNDFKKLVTSTHSSSDQHWLFHERFLPNMKTDPRIRDKINILLSGLPVCGKSGSGFKNMSGLFHSLHQGIH